MRLVLINLASDKTITKRLNKFTELFATSADHLKGLLTTFSKCLAGLLLILNLPLLHIAQLDNKLVIYYAIIRPIWTYAKEFCAASNSYILASTLVNSTLTFANRRLKCPPIWITNYVYIIDNS